MQDIHQHKILILDFGSQYTQLIARRVREIGCYCEIYPFSVDDQAIKAFGASGIILSGGPQTVTSTVTPRAPAAPSGSPRRTRRPPNARRAC